MSFVIISWQTGVRRRSRFPLSQTSLITVFLGRTYVDIDHDHIHLRLSKVERSLLSPNYSTTLIW
ncbi:hypothetical protein [Nostoc sp. CENA543]|uniref:hypothetical protein n=1 Tax=Nostoc sp. CENA543 TaxID=1869241 RepID=UPI0012FFDC40|nr:hypothetical protein [Nostoc sp. CENA543]